MAIEAVHSYLVLAGKNLQPQPEVAGTEIPLQGQVFEMLNAIYEKPQECTIDIGFAPSEDGRQFNERLTQVAAYALAPSLELGKTIAERLQEVTTNRSGLGLFFLLSGTERQGKRVILARFAANKALIAEFADGNLTVDFLDRVFMKNVAAYKAVVYTGMDPERDFWHGRAVDKQLNSETLSEYWIKSFLLSDFRTTSAQGTMRLANALKAVGAKTQDVRTRSEIAAVATLAQNLDGTVTSISGIMKKLSLSSEIQEAVQGHLRNDDRVLGETFRFDAQEFSKHTMYRMVELDTGAIMVADAREFDDVFNPKELDGGQRSYSTKGTPIDDHLRIRK